jgi:hypothetical protein
MQQRSFVSAENKHTIIMRPQDPDHPMEGIAPAYNDTDTQELQNEYLSVPVATKNFEFTCYNAKNESARVKLRDGKFLRIVTILRAAHALRWIANDPRKWVHGYPCDGPCSDRSGVFVDSPIVVAIKLDPNSVEVIPPTFITHLWRWTGNCMGGYVLFQNAEQFKDVFLAVQPAPH